MALGFATYYLNRTSRSGILEGAGPIGGYQQEGKWKLDARFTKENQIANIEALARFSPQIELSCGDALPFIKENMNNKDQLLYMDPPYYVQGAKLYKNFYKHTDHVNILKVLGSNRADAVWVLSYDDVAEIREIYHEFSPITYSLDYTAGRRATGREVIYLSDSVIAPTVAGFEVAA